MKTKKIYRWTTVILLIVEVSIAMIAPNESFIRHSFGDFLVVILLYCFAKSFIDINSNKLIVVVLIFSFTIEFSQYFQLADILGITNNIIRIIIGTSFSVSDLLMYSLGCLSIFLFNSFSRQ